jgi:GDP-L-fucose synthase
VRYYVAGHRGLVGSAICRRLVATGCEIITRDRHELDLINQAEVRSFFQQEKPDAVIIAAAKVGGILANNNYPAQFIYDNLMIEANLINSAYETSVGKLLLLSSSCVYPRDASQPIKEAQLLTGPLELTNEPYAVAKIAGMKLCESYNRQYGTDYRCVMPCNLYGPNDNFHPETSHVMPALIRRFHEARISAASEVVVWGTGSPLREFLHVDDMAEASLFVLNLPRQEWSGHVSERASHINVGTGTEISILELARMIADVTGYQGSISFDASKPDGTPRKLLDVSLLSGMGWKASIPLREGIEASYRWFLENQV